MNHFIPISINITNRKILVVGGGNVALLKASGLSRFTDNITILSPFVVDKLREYPFTFIPKLYDKNDLEGYFLVYACTDKRDLNDQIRKDCNKIGTLVAVCDNPTESDIVMPAICVADNVTIAVGTDGTSPKKGIKIRNQIQMLIKSGTIDINDIK